MRRARGQPVGCFFFAEFSGFFGLGFGGWSGGRARAVGCGHRSLPFGFGGWGPKPWRLKVWSMGWGRAEERKSKKRAGVQSTIRGGRVRHEDANEGDPIAIWVFDHGGGGAVSPTDSEDRGRPASGCFALNHLSNVNRSCDSRFQRCGAGWSVRLSCLPLDLGAKPLARCLREGIRLKLNLFGMGT